MKPLFGPGSKRCDILSPLFVDNPLLVYLCHGNGSGNELAWDVALVYPFLTGTGPQACLSLFPVADVVIHREIEERLYEYIK